MVEPTRAVLHGSHVSCGHTRSARIRTDAPARDLRKTAPPAIDSHEAVALGRNDIYTAMFIDRCVAIATQCRCGPSFCYLICGRIRNPDSYGNGRSFA